MCHENAKFKINGDEIVGLYTDMTKLEVELDDEMAGMFRLTIALEKQDDGAWSYLDDERFQVWQPVSIYAGFENWEDELFSGYITRIRPGFNPDPSQVTLEIWGMDNSILMNQDDKLKAWPSKKDSDIAAEIFDHYGFAQEVDNTEIVHDEEISTIFQRESDIQFLKRLARRNGFECFVDGSTGYFRPPQLDADPQPVLAIHFGVETNVSNFSIEVNTLTPSNVKMSQMDLFNKEVFNVTSESSEQTALGDTDATALLPAGQSPAQTVVYGNVATGIPEMTALCKGLRQQGEWFVTGEGEINGNKYGHVLKPRGTVTIKGVGETYSGIYYVSHVRHSFNRTGYTQYFKVRRNALQPTGSEDFSNGNGEFF